MSVSVKGKRKIVVDNVVYYWHIREDRYYDGDFFITYGTPFSLNIIAEDKSLYATVPVNGDKDAVKKLYPFDIPDEITPGFVKKSDLERITEEINMELIKGSPENTQGRQEREVRAYEFLDKLGVEFERTDHFDRPATTMEACADIDSVLNVHICKNLFLCNRQKTKFYLLIMPGDKPFKTKELSSQMGISRLSFADEAAMKEYLDLYPGSVSVLGLMNDAEHCVQLVIDEDVLKEEYFGCHPCVNTSSLRFKTTELTEKIIPALNITPITVHLVGGSD